MISTPKLAPDSRIGRGFPSLTCGFTGSFPFTPEHRRDLWLPILLPQRWGTDIASYPGREATTLPLASLSGISTGRRPQPHSLSILFILEVQRHRVHLILNHELHMKKLCVSSAECLQLFKKILLILAVIYNNGRSLDLPLYAENETTVQIMAWMRRTGSEKTKSIQFSRTLGFLSVPETQNFSGWTKSCV